MKCGCGDEGCENGDGEEGNEIPGGGKREREREREKKKEILVGGN